MSGPPSVGIAGVTPRLVTALPETLPAATRVGPHSVARPGMLLRVVPGIGRFLARGGTSLEYWVEPGAHPEAVAAVLRGAILGALIHQRGELPLHATSLVHPDGEHAVALAGRSGAGKSTTAYELIRRGWTLLSDDLTRVTIADGAALAWPGRSNLRLTGDACAAFGMAGEFLTPAPESPGKYVFEPPLAGRQVALSHVVVLEPGEWTLTAEELPRAAAARALAEQTYRIHYVEALGRTRRHFELVAATLASVHVVRLHGRASVVQVAEAVAAACTFSDPAGPVPSAR